MKREHEMRLPVARWLLSRGLAPVCEVQSLGNCDLVGVRFELKPLRLVELVAVELKLRDVPGVLRQCRNHMRRGVSEVYAALLPDVADKHFMTFAADGIGVLAVHPNEVVLRLDAVRFPYRDLRRWLPAMRRRRNEYQERMRHPLMLSTRTLRHQKQGTL